MAQAMDRDSDAGQQDDIDLMRDAENPEALQQDLSDSDMERE